MNSRLFARLRSPRLRWAIAYSALSLVSLLGIAHSTLRPLGRPSNPYQPRRTSDQIAQRSLTLCTGFSNSSRLLQEPLFVDELFIFPDAPIRHRPVWTVFCEADGRRYILQYNDLTGNLIGLRPDTGSIKRLLTRWAAPQINTPTEAATVALSRFAEMHLVPAGTRIALKQDPERIDLGQAWEMLWQAHPPAPAAPYEIKLVLARNGGIPVIEVDHRELAQYALN